MSEVGEIERITQNRIVHLLRDELGYHSLGNWEDRLNNSNIEEKLLRGYLITKGGYPEELVKRAIYKLQTEARNYDRTLYGNNKEVYKLLRYGVEVTAGAGEKPPTGSLAVFREQAILVVDGLNRAANLTGALMSV